MNRRGEFKGLINPSTTVVDNAIHTFFGLIYHDMGMEELNNGRCDVALCFLREAEKNITEIRSNKLCVAALHVSFVKVYIAKKDYNSALCRLEKARKIFQSGLQEINDKIKEVKYLKNGNRK